jgi:uncharacterized protein (DUF58 family)
MSLERVRITRVGVGFILLALIVGLAAANTGNNALYMVEATMLAALVVSGFASRRNLRGLRAEVEIPAEIYAKQPFSLAFRLTNRDRWSARRWLAVSVGAHRESALVPFIRRGGASQRGSLHLIFRRRGRHDIPHLRVASIYPLGIFFKVMRYAIGVELLIFPEILPVGVDVTRQTGHIGDEPSRTAGWGHELLSLRRFRGGDDPRGIHWKQTARTGGLVFMEREAEEGRRLSILLDNAVGRLDGPGEEDRFERLVSEAASAAVHYLKGGFEVELITRRNTLPFGRGRIHQLRVLEALALLEPVPVEKTPLGHFAPQASELRLGFAPRGAAVG